MGWGPVVDIVEGELNYLEVEHFLPLYLGQNQSAQWGVEVWREGHFYAQVYQDWYSLYDGWVLVGVHPC